MYNHAVLEDIDNIKVQAKMWGAEIKDDAAKPVKATEGETPFTFRAPEDYDNLSEQEKTELTQRMMGQHKQWANEKEVLKEKRPKWQGES